MTLNANLSHLTPAEPIQITIGRNGSGEVTQTQARTLSISGIVEIHLPFAEKRSLESIELMIGPGIQPCACYQLSHHDTL